MIVLGGGPWGSCLVMRVEAPWWDKSLEKKTTFCLFLHHVSTQSEDSHNQTRKSPAPDIRSAGAFDLGLPYLQNYEKYMSVVLATSSTLFSFVVVVQSQSCV